MRCFSSERETSHKVVGMTPQARMAVLSNSFHSWMIPRQWSFTTVAELSCNWFGATDSLPEGFGLAEPFWIPLGRVQVQLWQEGADSQTRQSLVPAVMEPFCSISEV